MNLADSFRVRDFTESATSLESIYEEDVQVMHNAEPDLFKPTN